MADNVQFTVNADATPPGGTLAATDELSDGSHAGLAKLLVSADGDRTAIPATSADGLLVNLGTNNDITLTQPVEVVGDAAVDDPVPANPLAVGGRGSYATPTGVNADGDSVFLWTDRRGRLIVGERSPTSATTQVADTASSTTLIAASTFRSGVSVTNSSSAALFLKCGTTASLTDYTVRIPQWGYWEAPYGYSGRIDGIWATDPGDGAAVITEFIL